MLWVHLQLNFAFPNNKFYDAYESIICFEVVKVRHGLERKSSVLESTNCRAHFILSLVIEINTKFLGKSDFHGKIVFTNMNFPK
jgi:hypothetical protein